MNHILELAERLAQTHDLPDDELLVLIRRRNPGASSFLKAEARALCDRIYGKEIYLRGLIEFTNKVLGTQQAFICNSRPRRFGKSITANMLAAYYSKGCDSENLFADLAVSDTVTEGLTI